MRKWATSLLIPVLLVVTFEAFAEESPEVGSELSDLTGSDLEGDIVDEFTFLMEEDIVESAARHKQEIGMSPSAITVITREDIEASGATTIPDLLRMVPGIEVVISARATQSVSGRLYWSDENIHYLVLVDGRDATLESLGQPPWITQPILIEDVERIEVIRGPGSSLYGANAMAGVVTITTRSVPRETSAWARITGGEAGMAAAAVRATTRVGDWGFSVSGEVERSGTFVDPRVHGLDVWKIRGVVEYQWAESKRLLLDGSFAIGWGPYATGLGALDMDSSVASLRLAYQSKDIRGHVYWDYVPVELALGAPLVYSGIRLAEFVSAEISSHSVNAEVQWTLPELWKPMLVIVGATGRIFLISSDQLLDADSFSDITSSDYHRPGIEHLEVRAGGFLHAEVAPTDLVTVTGGIRFDYNTVGGAFISPRLASVFRPAPGQFLRLGVARAFRKPAFLETSFHLMAEFPDDSPITGPAQLKFQEFLTRVVGNNDVGNEELTSFEVGYLGQFLDDKLSVAVDLYCNLYRNMVEFRSNIVPDEQGLPDLDISSFQFDNVGRNLDIFGGELAVRYEVADGVRLLASWSHRQARNSETGDWESRSPKNLLTLGGRFVTRKGLLGSLYLFSRSEFTDVGVQNPEGILAPYQRQRLGNDFLVLGKLGWKWEPGGGFEMETGVRLFLPVNPFSAPHFRYYEKGGGVTAKGNRYGGIELARMVTGYLQGSF